VKRENEAKFRPQEPQQRRRDPEHDDKPIVPLSEGIKGWRERLGVSKNEGGDNGDSNR